MLPNDINDMTFILSHKVDSVYKESHYATYGRHLIEFTWMRDTSVYYITIYECKNSNNMDSISSINHFEYDEYKYETEEITQFIEDHKNEVRDFDTAKKLIITKYTNSIRKEKIKKLLEC